MAIGIIGEYVGRIYDEVKQRPLYLVRARRNVAAATPRPTPRTTACRSAPREGRRPRGGHGRARRRALRLAEQGHALRRLRALARARRAGGDARRRRRRTGSSATTTTSSRATATSPRCTTSSASPDELEWRPSSVAVFAEGRSWPFTGPLDLLRFRPMSPVARVRMGLAVVAAPAPPPRRRAVRARDGARLGAAGDGRAGVGGGLGAAARGQVRRPRRRHLDGLAVEQADPAPPDRGRGGAQGAARLPAAAAGSRCSTACARRSSARGGRVLIDRPAQRLARAGDGGLLVTAGAPGAFRARPRPAAVRRRPESRERYDGVVATVPSDVFVQPARRRPRRRGGRRLPRPRARRRVPRRRSACCSSSTGGSRRSTGPTSPTATCRSSASSSTRTSSSPSATAAGGSSTSPTTSRPATSCSASTPDALLAALRGGPAQGQPGVRRARGSASAGCSASPPPSRSSPSATASGSRRSRPACPGLVLANTTQIYPEDRGTNYSVRLGEDAARALARSLTEQAA